jgi:hypothetical protein
MRRAALRLRYRRMMTGPPHSDAAQRNYADNAHSGSCASLPKNKNKQAPSTPHTHGAVLKSQAAESDGVSTTGSRVMRADAGGE